MKEAAKVKERPAIFSAKSVIAILEGEKRKLYAPAGADPNGREHLTRRIMNGIDADGCWIWGRATSSGYGCMTVAQKTVRVPRLVLALVLGKPITEIVETCHRCDKPLCVNPEHLFEGSHADNVRDAISKGRATPPVPSVLMGEQNPAAKLTDAQAREIVDALALREKQRVIAARYGVSQSTISLIKVGKRHV